MPQHWKWLGCAVEELNLECVMRPLGTDMELLLWRCVSLFLYGIEFELDLRWCGGRCFEEETHRLECERKWIFDATSCSWDRSERDGVGGGLQMDDMVVVMEKKREIRCSMFNWWVYVIPSSSPGWSVVELLTCAISESLKQSLLCLEEGKDNRGNARRHSVYLVGTEQRGG